MATEDLLDPTVYLATVNEHLSDAGAGVQVTREELESDDTIAHALETWCETQGVATPGKVAIASRLIQKSEDLRLTQSGAEALRQLHHDLEHVFNPRKASRSG